MPIIKSAVKRMKQAVNRRERNQSVKKDVKSAVRAFTDKPSAASLSKAQSEIDTAVKKNLLHKNTAARRKSNLAKIAKEAGVKPVAAKKAAPKKTAPKKSTSTKTAAAKPATKKTPAKKTAATKPTTAKKTTTKKD